MQFGNRIDLKFTLGVRALHGRLNAIHQVVNVFTLGDQRSFGRIDCCSNRAALVMTENQDQRRLKYFDAVFERPDNCFR